jgi:glutathione S-transferase
MTAATGTAPCRLVTIPISHYCEKARWALDRAGIPFEERAHLQVLHRIAARRAGGRTVPVLLTPEGVLGESADILAYADARTPRGRRLFPEDAEAAAEVRAVERDLDERLGPHGRRWMYNELRGDRDVAGRYGLTGVPAWERRIFPAFYPLMSALVDRVLDVDAETSAASERVVRDLWDEFGARLADGRRYLVGDTFTAADLTFAALAAPIVLPPEYGVPLPRAEELPDHMAAVVRELSAQPAGAFALRMFREERRTRP